ncbi:Uncharacterized protein GBIM_17496 [Gryllus bimaculatus]|nr:Uncharacterized protein GBIM_17496 [Gryllus bimaculatus]
MEVATMNRPVMAVQERRGETRQGNEGQGGCERALARRLEPEHELSREPGGVAGGGWRCPGRCGTIDQQAETRGLAGPRGRPGKPGLNGTPGVPGISAYTYKGNATRASELLIPPSIVGE